MVMLWPEQLCLKNVFGELTGNGSGCVGIINGSQWWEEVVVAWPRSEKKIRLGEGEEVEERVLLLCLLESLSLN